MNTKPKLHLEGGLFILLAESVAVCLLAWTTFLKFWALTPLQLSDALSQGFELLICYSVCGRGGGGGIF